MKKLRSLHLYLGCIFAPMMLFFTVSGLWQTWYPPFGVSSKILAELSTIHTRMMLKNGVSLGNNVLRYFVLVMGVSFIFSTILGVIMAVKHGGSRKAAYACLAFGILCPLAIILIGLITK